MEYESCRNYSSKLLNILRFQRNILFSWLEQPTTKSSGYQTETVFSHVKKVISLKYDSTPKKLPSKTDQ